MLYSNQKLSRWVESNICPQREDGLDSPSGNAAASVSCISKEKEQDCFLQETQQQAVRANFCFKFYKENKCGFFPPIIYLWQRFRFLFPSLLYYPSQNIRGVCLLSYSHSKDCPLEKKKFYLSEAKESFEIGLLTKNEKSHITSKQELHSFIKAAFCLTTVHRWLYGESEELCEVSQLCRKAMGKLHSYSTSLTAEEEKGTLAKEIMCLITSVKKRLQVESFLNSDARSYVPDSYKGTVEKPILRGAASFEKILAMHSQHHLSVCEVFEKACRTHKTVPGETQVGICITTLRTETNNIDTVCTTEETGNHRKGAVKTSPAGSTLERLSGQRNKYLGPDKEIEPLEIKINGVTPGFSRLQNRSQTTTSESSWCKLSRSGYSSSWEELNCNNSKEYPGDGQQQEKSSVQEQCCTTESDENDQAAYSCSLTRRVQHPPPREPLGSCWESPQPSLEVDTALVEKTSLCGEELWEGRHSGKSCTGKRSGEVNNMLPSLSTSYFVPTRPEEKEEEEVESSSVCRTKDSGREGGGGAFVWVHPDGGTADSTEYTQSEAHLPINGVASVVSTCMEEKMASDSSGSDSPRKSDMVGNRSLQVPEVDVQAETVDDTESDFVSVEDLVNNHPTATVPKHQSIPSAPTALPLGGKISLTKNFDCATTEEDEEKPQDMLSIERQSSSSLSSWCKSAQMPKRSPEGSSLNTRGSGFVFVPGRTKEEILNARFLRDDDYMQLLAGVEHNWLVQRLMPTGIFKPKQLHKAYCKFPHRVGHFHTATGAPTENSLDSGFLTQCFSQHLLGLLLLLCVRILAKEELSLKPFSLVSPYPCAHQSHLHGNGAVLQSVQGLYSRKEKVLLV